MSLLTKDQINYDMLNFSVFIEDIEIKSIDRLTAIVSFKDRFSENINVYYRYEDETDCWDWFSIVRF